jgi:hypothetical protein
MTGLLRPGLQAVPQHIDQAGNVAPGGNRTPRVHADQLEEGVVQQRPHQRTRDHLRISGTHAPERHLTLEVARERLEPAQRGRLLQLAADASPRTRRPDHHQPRQVVVEVRDDVERDLDQVAFRVARSGLALECVDPDRRLAQAQGLGEQRFFGAKAAIDQGLGDARATRDRERGGAEAAGQEQLARGRQDLLVADGLAARHD